MARIADFAALIATAVANTAAHEQLNASRDRLHQLARPRTGLRRVAGLVAREAEPAEVFAAVAEKAAVCLNAYNATMGRFDGDEIVIEALGRAQLELSTKPAVGIGSPWRPHRADDSAHRPARPDG